MARITPSEVKSVIESFKKDDYHEIHFSIIGVYRGQPCIRTYFAKKISYYKKIKKVLCREVMRDFLDGKRLCLGSLYVTSYGNWHIIWNKHQNSSLVGVYESAPRYSSHFVEMKECYKNKKIGYPTYGTGEAFNILCHYIPHFHLDKETFDRYERWDSNIFVYARQYLDNPLIELISKQGFGFLCTDKRIFRLGKEKQSELYHYLKQYKNAIIEHQYSYDDIQWMRKLGLDPNEYENNCDDVRLYKETSFYCHRRGMSLAKAKEIHNYIKKHSYTGWEYAQYTSDLVELGMDLNDRNLMPGDFNEAQKNVREAVSKMENEQLNHAKEHESEILNSIKEAITSENGNIINGYEIFVPRCFQDFVDISNSLNNCVVRLGYDKKMARGKCVIFALKKDGKFVTCNEVTFLNGKPRLEQSYRDEKTGYGSKETIPSKEEISTAVNFMSTLKQSVIKKAIRA